MPSGGWAGSDRGSRLPADWPRLRAITLKNCQHRCQAIIEGVGRCNGRATQADHIIPGDDHSLRNLQGLCEYHHSIKSSAEGVEAKAKKAGSAKRPSEKHPGER